MSAFTLKMIALVTMVIDHVGAVFFPDLIWLRYIGRLSMPIYAFPPACGGLPQNEELPALCAAPCAFRRAFRGAVRLLFQGRVLEFSRQNILFTLLTALLVMRLLDLAAKKRNVFLFSARCFSPWPRIFLHFSYGVYGVLSVLCFFLFQKYRGIDAIAFSALTYGRYPVRRQLHAAVRHRGEYPDSAVQPESAGAVSLKYFFYIIYPAHLLVLYAIHYILANHLLPF